METEVVVVGGGLAGSVLAAGLGRMGISTVLLDHAEPAAALNDDIDLRVIALSMAGQRLLDNLGLWKLVQARPVSGFENMHVWDANGHGSVRFEAGQLKLPTLGYMVENAAITRAAWQACHMLPQVTVKAPESIEQLERVTGGYELQLSSGELLSCQLLVVADGAQSQLRAQLGFDCQRWEYNQTAIVAHVETEIPHQNTAWQRFLRSGPLAFLPLADGRSSIVWSADKARADELLALDDRAFRSELAEAFDYRLGHIDGCTKRVGFPLAAAQVEQYVQEGVAIVGDAAHVVHPLAGQGANMGLLDAACLLDVLQQAKDRNLPIGSISVLRRYQRWRKGENAAMLLALDGFKRLFAIEQPGVGQLRNVGMNLVDLARPIKNQIARRAIGVAGDLPSLAKAP